MKHKYLPAVIAMLTAVCLLFSGCGLFVLQSIFSFSTQKETTEATEAPQTQTPTETSAPFEEVPDWSLVFPRQQNAGGRDYLPDGDVSMLRFDELEYSRPDVEGLCSAFDALLELIRGGAAAEEILPVFYDTYDLYYHFYTMDTLANIRYYADLTNEYYEKEYDFCEQASPDIEEKLESTMKACAESSEKAALEEQYFGEGYLDQYLDYSVYTNPEYLALSKQEKAIMEQYHSAMDDPQVEYNGEKQSFWDLMEEYEDDYAAYLEILETYYNTYNPVIGECYVQLVGIRQQMAQVLGYESYADYAYDKIYERDYTWDDGKNYVASIREELVPLYADLEEGGLLYEYTYGPSDENLDRKCLNHVVNKLGGTVLEAYNYMIAYDLSDLTECDEKMDTSFTTYMFELESPYILINPQGTTDDIFTFAHEFGHFTDMYHSYQSEEDLETAETFSQGLEWLALCNLDGCVSKSELESMRISKLTDTVAVFISQAAYADFEDRVYSLPVDSLTVDVINDIYREVCMDYGFYSYFADFYYSMSWIDVPHFFESAYYVISYCVSADTALQIYQHELETPGAGLDLYNTLLDRTAGDGLQAVTEAACMENPFSEGRLKEIADFLYEQLDLR